MDAVADLADQFSFGEMRVTHRQNLTFTDVKQDELFALWEKLEALDLAAANHSADRRQHLLPGPRLLRARERALDPDRAGDLAALRGPEAQKDIGPLELNMSGCINACGHHHVGNIGILGVDKAGEELYQLQLGGSSREDAALAEITGRGFAADEITDAVETVVDTYLELRTEGEEFIDTYRRVGMDPFKQKLYDAS